MNYRADISWVDGSQETIYFKEHQEDEQEYNLMRCFEWIGGNHRKFTFFNAMRITKRHLKSIKFYEDATMTTFTMMQYPEIGAYFEENDLPEVVDHIGDVSI